MEPVVAGGSAANGTGDAAVGVAGVNCVGRSGEAGKPGDGARGSAFALPLATSTTSSLADPPIQSASAAASPTPLIRIAEYRITAGSRSLLSKPQGARA